MEPNVEGKDEVEVIWSRRNLIFVIEIFSLLTATALLCSTVWMTIVFSCRNLSYLSIATAGDIIRDGVFGLLVIIPICVSGYIILELFKRSEIFINKSNDVPDLLRYHWPTFTISVLTCLSGFLMYAEFSDDDIKVNHWPILAALMLSLILFGLLRLAESLSGWRFGRTSAVIGIMLYALVPLSIRESHRLIKDGFAGRNVKLIDTKEGCEGRLWWIGEKALIVQCASGHMRIVVEPQGLTFEL